jgi:hypothetical protein
MAPSDGLGMSAIPPLSEEVAHIQDSWKRDEEERADDEF